VILGSLDRSPLFGGAIEGTGPRYCPSIEDKVVRFPHHRTHTVFVEPEGLASEWMYVNGLSTSLPRDVQEEVVRLVPGLESAEVLQYGYAVEYAVLAPGQVTATLRLADVPGVYVAGQILGTSGYEEAAGTGLVAGVNAVREPCGERPLVVGRHEGYLGVLVDDLVHREHEEPYRMLTSRAEHRLRLGVDSARERLMARGVELGLVAAEAFHVEQSRWLRLASAIRGLEEERLDREEAAAAAEVLAVPVASGRSWGDLARRTDVDPGRVGALAPALAELEGSDQEVAVSRVRYAGYIAKQDREIARLRRLRSATIPDGVDFSRVAGLSREVVESLSRRRPRTLAEAERVPGMTPAALAVLAATVGGDATE
jgi:tRNA uridine 5-carboxymethylaminomethyl modification enzyme